MPAPTIAAGPLGLARAEGRLCRPLLDSSPYVRPLWTRLAPELAVWTLLPFLVLDAGGLMVDTPSPDALCPPLEQTRSIIESRLGTIELEGTWRATYVLVHRERGDLVLLKLRDPSGQVRLEREFAADEGTCVTLAQVIALVLERYFLRPEAGVQGSTPDADILKDPNGALKRKLVEPTLVAPEPKRQVTIPAEGVASSLPTAPATLARADSGVNYWLAASLWVSSAWVAPSIGVGLRLDRHWGFGLMGGYDFSSHAQRISEGWGMSNRVPVALQVRRQLVSGALRLDLGAELLGLYEHVHTEALAENGSGSRLVQGAGLRLSTELLPPHHKVCPFLDATASLLFPGMSRNFEVDHRSVFGLKTGVIGVNFGIRTNL